MSPAPSAFEQQIVYAYELLGLTPQQIAQQFEEAGESEETIIGILSNHSQKYITELRYRTKDAVKAGDDKELAELETEYTILARTSKNDLVKERALKFLINEKKGRNDLGEKNLKLKERALNLATVDTAKRGVEFIEAMKKINQQIHNALEVKPLKLSSPKG